MNNNYWIGKVEKHSAGHDMKIKLIKSTFHNEKSTKKALADFLVSTDRLSMGEQCLLFEKQFAKKQKRKHAVLVNSGSMANLLLIQALMNLGRLNQGDRIGFSALTWPTNVMPLIQLGLVPVPLDCSLKTLNVTPETLKSKINNLQGLFLTNVLGFCDNIEEIQKMCEKKGVVFIEDNCESLGSKAYGKLLGNFGQASTFSFFVGHHMSTIEGGMVCTDDEELYHALVVARAHGWSRNLNPEHQKQLRKTHNVDGFYERYTFYELAFNARPNEITGFLGNQQLEHLDEIINVRNMHFKSFFAAIKNNDEFIDYELDHMDVVSNFAMPVICKTKTKIKHYKKAFIDADVEIRPIIAGNITRQPFYKKYASEDNTCPNSDIVHSNGFYFGNNAEMTKKEVNTLCKLLEK